MATTMRRGERAGKPPFSRQRGRRANPAVGTMRTESMGASSMIRRAVALGGFAILAGAAFGQDASVPPPPSANRSEGRHVHELLPDIGLIGAQVGLVGGLCFEPYETGR